MSDPTPSSSSPSPDLTAVPGATPPKPAKRRRWKRILIIACIAIIACALAARLAIALLFPSVLRKVAAAYDFDANYERMELYFLGGDVGLTHLTFTPKTGGEPTLDMEYCRADVSALNLLRGRLVVRRVEADGVAMNVDREADGTIPLIQKLFGGGVPEPERPTEWSLEPPLRVDMLRLSRIRAKWRDRFVQPPIETLVDMTMRLSDLGSTIRPTKFYLDITSQPLLDTLRIEGEGTSRNQVLDATMSVLVRGLHPKPAAGYLAPLGIKAVADDINVQCIAKVNARTLGPATTTRPADIAGDITIEGITVRADGREAAGIDRVLIKADKVNGLMAHFGSALIEGVRAAAERTAEGNVRVAGLELVPIAAPTTPTTRPALIAARQSPSTWVVERSLADLTIRNVRATFADASVTPPADLAFIVNKLNVTNLRADGTCQITGDFTAPGLAKAIALTGTAKPFSATQTLDAKLRVQGIKPEAIKGYLDAAGLEATMTDANAACDLRASVTPGADGRLGAELNLANIKLADANELFAFDAARIAGVSMDPADGSIRIQSIDLAGPRLAIERDADGSIRTLGLRTKGATTQPAVAAVANRAGAAPATAPAGAVANAAALPKVEITKLTWKGIAVQFNDRAVEPPFETKLSDAGVELTNVRIGLEPSTTQPGRIKAWMTAPGMAQVNVTGTVVPIAGGMRADVDIAANGLNAEPLARYLKPAGIEPTLRDGSASLHARAQLAQGQGDALHAALKVEKLIYAEAKQELVGLDALSVDGVELRESAITVAAVQVDRPRARVERDAEGGFRLAGMRIAPPSTQPAPAEASVAAAPTTAPAAPADPPMVASLGKLRVNGGAITWIDNAVQPIANTVGSANVELDGLVVGKKADPARFKLTAKLDQTLESAIVTGTLVADASSPRLSAEVAANGIRQGVLASYLPPGTTISLNDGRFHAKLDAHAAPNPKGGQSAALVISSVDYRDGDAQQTLLRFDSAKVIVSRVDVPGGVVAIDEISLSGFETGAEKHADGSLRALGLSIAPAPPPTASAQPAAAAPAVATAGSSDVNMLLARQKQKPPLVTLEKLDVELKRIAYRDLSQPEAQPLALADCRLRNIKRVEMLGEDAQSRPPAEFELTGKVDPVVGNFNVAAVTAPFAMPATLNVKVAAAGIRGDGLTEIMPQLREQIDGSGLTDGRFAAAFEAEAKIEQSRPGVLDFARPIEVTASFRDVAYRAAPDTPVLMGVEEVRAEPVRYDPKSGSVVVRTLEISKPIARAHRDQEGIHALGLLIRETSAATQPAQSAPSSTQSTPPPVSSEAILASETSLPGPPPTKPEAEYRIDKLLVSGIDVIVEDRSVTPPLIVPLTSLETEVRDLNNLALHEDRPIRFNLTAGAGKVPLKEGKEREMFSEVAASGSLSFYPEPHGWARSSVSALELVALAGPAAAQKVIIENGIFDSRVEVKILDDGALDTRSRFAFTDLRMSEPSDGPVKSVLKLPAPLDTVILVMQDQSGAITVPLSVKVKEGTLSGGQLAGAAVSALGGIIGTAMASAPLKVTGGVTSMVGLDQAVPMLGKKKSKGPQPAGQIAFAPGVADPQDTRAMDDLVRRLQKEKSLEVTLKHEIGGGDVALAQTRANPTPEQCLAIAAQLRQRKSELMRARAPLAAKAQAILLADPNAADPLAALHVVDRDLGATEDALDRVYDLLRPGADRQADRRTRAACMQLGEERLATLREMIVAAGIPDADKRVKLISPTVAAAEGDQGGQVVLIASQGKK